jgi:hypothetical protein
MTSAATIPQTTLAKATNETRRRPEIDTKHYENVTVLHYTSASTKIERAEISVEM